MGDLLWHLLRTSDSFFPTGGFSHSGGLEGLAAEGCLADPAAAVRAVFEEAFVPVDLPACGLAHRAVGDVDALARIDATLDALKAPRELRESSRSLGRRRMKVSAVPAAYRARVEAGASPGHQAVVTGAHLALAGASRAEAMTAFAYQSAAGLVAAAMKLGPLGQTRAQEILETIGESMAARVAAADLVTVDGLGAFTPLLDIAALRHETASTRLFIS
ncbi:MAG TPA: urease accessory UreF family protein [Planctomycetota bacterium]